MEYFINIDTKKYYLKIYLCKSFKSIENFHKKIQLDIDLLHVSLNPQHIISLKALLLGLYRTLKQKKSSNLDVFEFQKDLGFFLAPEDQKDFKHIYQDDVLRQPSLQVFVNLSHEKEELIDSLFTQDAELDHMTNLLEYTNIQNIKKNYKISDIELGLDTDIRGSIYNQIALKRINK